MHPFQKQFYARMAEPQSLAAVLDHLPGVFFLVKDTEGRFVTANAATRERLGARSESTFVGTTDADYVPLELVKDFREDDLRVIRSGKPMLNRMEAWLDEQGQLQWFVTTKLPLKGKNGRCIGVMAVIRQHDERRSHHFTGEIAETVACLRANLHKIKTAAQLARAAGTSERSLRRRLQQMLGITPYELMLRIRIEAAAKALASSTASIGDIALDHGFCDQSSFTRHFRERTGQTPRQFRLRHRGT
ncbi:helix-turn-helix domain-containing protein [Prosthecobacter vanneervenii]|uniref:PAS domain S-box-containing protein n=1 Tax=Prosthecobacter vanneervenii TaxID=48466 RepID=A0A7W7Y8R3_9BACT|nr:helix-turn-helix domain-containing protein [Prosthecobacter vanneervenii]MBB5031614.1 PAS domain S-box-containing protein [Prosthecobacter vanneervenii]